MENILDCSVVILWFVVRYVHVTKPSKQLLYFSQRKYLVIDYLQNNEEIRILLKGAIGNQY